MDKKKLWSKKRLSKIKGKKNTSIRCPQCNSTDITYYMGAQFGKYQCKSCNYIGVLVLEKNEKSE